MASKQEWKRRALDATNTLDFWQRRAEQLEQEMNLLKKEVAQARGWAERAEAELGYSVIEYCHLCGSPKDEAHGLCSPGPIG